MIENFAMAYANAYHQDKGAVLAYDNIAFHEALKGIQRYRRGLKQGAGMTAEQPDEVALLLEEVAAEEKRNAFHRERDRYHEENHGEEHAETLDPWERPVDWWKRSDDE